MRITVDHHRRWVELEPNELRDLRRAADILSELGVLETDRQRERNCGCTAASIGEVYWEYIKGPVECTYNPDWDYLLDSKDGGGEEPNRA